MYHFCQRLTLSLIHCANILTGATSYGKQLLESNLLKLIIPGATPNNPENPKEVHQIFILIPPAHIDFKPTNQTHRTKKTSNLHICAGLQCRLCGHFITRTGLQNKGNNKWTTKFAFLMKDHLSVCEQVPEDQRQDLLTHNTRIRHPDLVMGLGLQCVLLPLLVKVSVDGLVVEKWIRDPVTNQESLFVELIDTHAQVVTNPNPEAVAVDTISVRADSVVYALKLFDENAEIHEELGGEPGNSCILKLLHTITGGQVPMEDLAYMKRKLEHVRCKVNEWEEKHVPVQEREGSKVFGNVFSSPSSSPDPDDVVLGEDYASTAGAFGDVEPSLTPIPFGQTSDYTEPTTECNDAARPYPYDNSAYYASNAVDHSVNSRSLSEHPAQTNGSRQYHGNCTTGPYPCENTASASYAVDHSVNSRSLSEHPAQTNGSCQYHGYCTTGPYQYENTASASASASNAIAHSINSRSLFEYNGSGSGRIISE